MLLTVTANSALDRIFFIEEFEPGATIRPQKVIDSVGGKGFDTSVALRALGQKTLALGFVGGRSGTKLVHLLEQYGIEHNLVWIEGETRIANVICETRLRRHSHLMEGGYTVSPGDFEAFLRVFERRLPEAKWVIAAGSIPNGLPLGFYRTITELATRANVPTLLDCADSPALAAIPAGPTVLKMNRAEFARTFAVRGDGLEELVASAFGVYREYALHALVITCGRDGLVAITPEGCYRATTLQQEAVNAAGAGDAASAALVWRLSLQETWPEALRWAAAIGAATVLTERTAECRLSDAELIYRSVCVEEIQSDPRR